MRWTNLLLVGVGLLMVSGCVVYSRPRPVYYGRPAYAQPVYAQPVYARPVAQPVYARPVR
jgi:hypothetical protein